MTPVALVVTVCVGVESPSHAIRADADPLARSATSVMITLADKYTYDCPVQILIYPSGRSHLTRPSNSALEYNILKQLISAPAGVLYCCFPTYHRISCDV